MIWAEKQTHLTPALRGIETFKYHPSILKVKEFMTDKYMTFSFNYTAQEKVYQTRQNLDKKKTCQENDILVKIIKSHYDTFSYFIIHKIKKKKKKKKKK